MRQIVLDLGGADNGAWVLVQGASMALQAEADLSFLLVGQGEAVQQALQSGLLDANRVELLPAERQIDPGDAPDSILHEAGDTSMALALDALRTRQEAVGLLSAGNTGALLVGSIFRLGLVPPLRTPALASAIPTVQGDRVILLDCGANLAPGTREYEQFALLGAAYAARLMPHRTEIRVGVLSVGRESTKGTQSVRQAYAALEALEFPRGGRFIGCVEGCDLCSGVADVIVCDGYAGNLLLKAHEAAGLAAMEAVRMLPITQTAQAKTLARLAELYELNLRGGAAFLGTVKPVIKMHGCAQAQTVCACTAQLLRSL